MGWCRILQKRQGVKLLRGSDSLSPSFPDFLVTAGNRKKGVPLSKISMTGSIKKKLPENSTPGGIMMTRILKTIALSLALLMLFTISEAMAGEKLVLLVTLIRHGDRNPTSEITVSPQTWLRGLGELTPEGIHQEYLLGQSFRTRYVDELKFLPPSYENNSIFATSTNINRTITSGLVFLGGLYPPGTGPMLENGCPAMPSAYQPIPIRTTFKDPDSMIRDSESSMKQFREMVKTVLFPSPEWQAKIQRYEQEFPRWSRILGVKIETLIDLVQPGDNLHVRLLKGVPLPPGLTREEAREIADLSRWVIVNEFRPSVIAHMIGGYLLNDIVGHMQKTIDGAQVHKMFLYSGHDSNIISVRAALGIPMDSIPPYASNLSFELYQNKEGYSVIMRFIGRELEMPWAGGKTECTFEQFKAAALEDYRP